jgi:NADH:ubiquinone oxidoreductase subunit 3 (subunit A)
MGLFAQAAATHGSDMTAAVVVGIVAFLAMICVVVSLALKHEAKKREFRHAERMKAYDSGQAPPEAEVARATAIGFIGTLVPLAAIGVGLGATAMLWRDDAANLEFNYGLLKVIWLVCGGLAAATAVGCLHALRRGGLLGDQSEPASISARSHREGPRQEPM